jgi:hypothetical protein
MKYIFALTFLYIVSVLQGCVNQRFYNYRDYSFYSPMQVNPGKLALRTDGVYILDEIITDGNGEQSKTASVAEIFKFYDGGQVNQVLSPKKSLTADECVEVFNDRIAKRLKTSTPTQFEGYYRQKNDSIVVQQISTPTRQLYYTYGYVNNGALIIVSQTHATSGKLAAKHYNNNYKAVYRFIYTGKSGYLAPNW